MKTKNFFAQKAKLENITCIIPTTNIGIEILSKINGEFLISIKQYRNLKFHKKLMGICRKFVNDDFFILLADKWNDVMTVFNLQLNLTPEIIQRTRLLYNDDVYSFIYFCKAVFLEWERDPIRNELKVNSIAFEVMDNLIFQEFYKKVIDLLEFLLDIEIERR